MPCECCGESVATALVEEHACVEERRLDYQVFQLRDEVACFDAELDAWLESPAGCFERFYARRARS
jgi:hypothetical protein